MFGFGTAKMGAGIAALLGGDCMFLTLAIILAVIWCIFWLALHVTSGLIHILIALAVISFIVHLFRGRPAAV